MIRDTDLRNAPFFLKEGDVIGYRIQAMGEEPIVDDWDTVECVQMR